MTEDEFATVDLLRAWHGGDRAALLALVDRDREWVFARVRRGRGPLLQRDADTIDHVQDLMLEVLEYSPRFLVRDRAQFRALVARMIDNLLIDGARRAARRPRFASPVTAQTGQESIVSLDPALRVSDAPPERAAQAEELDWLRLGLEFLDDDERKVVRAHRLEGRTFVEIGSELGLEPNTVRMRCNRAVLRLAGIVRRLQSGGLDDLLAERGEPQ
ncbi:MAG: sigma-70 family RNA polymerase sigma factor [Planctomycetes bacterium]|nr:sigma-70 family RNA polymerase sigma factor [Planctomycetota bacterium]